MCPPNAGWLLLMKPFRIAVLSDLHYASEAEQRREGYCLRIVRNPIRRAALAAYRRFYWQHDPFAHNYLLDDFIHAARGADLVVANGDYSCDSGFIGLADDASFASARESLQKLRDAFGQRFIGTIGDHELGKMPLGAGIGGLRLASYQRAIGDLQLEPFWLRRIGRYVLMGVTSTLVALPLHEEDALPGEINQWHELRSQVRDQIAKAFESIQDDERVILFCHDPAALPLMAEWPQVSRKTANIVCTVIGHLHSDFVYWQSQLLCGMPFIPGLGHTVKRVSSALRRARLWKPFKVVLCPSLAGIQLLKDGGYLTIDLHADHHIVTRGHLPWR